MIPLKCIIVHIMVLKLESIVIFPKSKVKLMSHHFMFKSPLLSLMQFLAAGRALKMMKNAFYVMLKTFFVFKIFKFLPRLSGHVMA